MHGKVKAVPTTRENKMNKILENNYLEQEKGEAEKRPLFGGKKTKLILLFFLLALLFGFFSASNRQKQNVQEKLSTKTNTPSPARENKISQADIDGAKDVASRAIEESETIEDFETYSDQIKNSVVFSPEYKSFLIKSLPENKKLVDEIGLSQSFEASGADIVKVSSDEIVFRFTGTEKQQYLKSKEEFSEEQIFIVTATRIKGEFLVTKIASDTEPLKDNEQVTNPPEEE
jgi:hypothetical protein